MSLTTFSIETSRSRLCSRPLVSRTSAPWCVARYHADRDVSHAQYHCTTASVIAQESHRHQTVVDCRAVRSTLRHFVTSFVTSSLRHFVPEYHGYHLNRDTLLAEHTPRCARFSYVDPLMCRKLVRRPWCVARSVPLYYRKCYRAGVSLTSTGRWLSGCLIHTSSLRYFVRDFVTSSLRHFIPECPGYHLNRDTLLAEHTPRCATCLSIQNRLTTDT